VYLAFSGDCRKIERPLAGRETLTVQVSACTIVAMNPSQMEIDALYRERVLAAKAMPPEEKLLAGPRLFDFSCRIMADGIRGEYPGADEAEVQKILCERLAFIRQLEDNP
jgi:hypothetical protein